MSSRPIISYNELLSGNCISDVPQGHQINLAELQKRLQLVRDAWGRPMNVTSGYRSLQQHLRIYHKLGKHGDQVPMNSAHLSGLAADFADHPDGALYAWLREDPKGIAVMERAGLYGEEGTNGWVHLQSRAPRSGKRWFKP